MYRIKDSIFPRLIIPVKVLSKRTGKVRDTDKHNPLDGLSSTFTFIFHIWAWIHVLELFLESSISYKLKHLDNLFKSHVCNLPIYNCGVFLLMAAITSNIYSERYAISVFWSCLRICFKKL